LDFSFFSYAAQAAYEEAILDFSSTA